MVSRATAPSCIASCRQRRASASTESELPAGSCLCHQISTRSCCGSDLPGTLKAIEALADGKVMPRSHQQIHIARLMLLSTPPKEPNNPQLHARTLLTAVCMLRRNLSNQGVSALLPIQARLGTLRMVCHKLNPPRSSGRTPSHGIGRTTHLHPKGYGTGDHT